LQAAKANSPGERVSFWDRACTSVQQVFLKYDFFFAKIQTAFLCNALLFSVQRLCPFVFLVTVRQMMNMELVLNVLTREKQSTIKTAAVPLCFKDKNYPQLYIKIQSVPRSKHTPSRL
jgi:hypothetical protein